MKLGTTLEKRWSEISSLNDLTRSQVSATLQYRVKNGDQLSLGINLQDTASDKVNISNQSAVANLSYSFGKPLASVNLSTGVSIGYTHYDSFTNIRPVEGGRTDTSVYGDLTMVFSKMDFAGFVLSVQIRTGKKSSNISRFNSKELSVSLGIQSKS